MSRYPYIGPFTHINPLGNGTVLLTNLRDFKTKLLYSYQYKIISKCNGKNDIYQIKQLLEFENVPYSIINQVEKYIDKMIEWGYIMWSPLPLLETKGEFPDNINNKCSKILNPLTLHSITISVLDTCCLKCEYCSQNAPVGKGNMFTINEIKKILDDGYELGARIFSIFGGEPTMHPNLSEMIRYAYLKGYRHIEISTKGTLINYDLACKLHANGLNKVQLTVDSHKPYIYDRIVGVSGAFLKMMEGLYCLHTQGIEIKMKIIMTKMNAKDIINTIIFFAQNGVREFNVEVVVPVGRANFEVLPTIEEIYQVESEMKEVKERFKLKSCSLQYMNYGKPKQCAGGINSIFIFADGETGPCDKSYFVKDKLSFGNIKTKSLIEIWNSSSVNYMRKLRNDSDICKKCNESDVCMGGCILNSIIISNKIGPDPMCSKISQKRGIFPIE